MKISVITPSFNQEEFIERTILSVISQKGDFDLEYIIVDGLSSDKSLEIIKEYEEKLKSGAFPTACKSIDFIWKSEKDSGQSDAINKWLRMATGDIVTYLNSDDTYLPGALEAVIKNLWNANYKWCYGKCKIIDKQDIEIRKWITLYKNILAKKYVYSKLLCENFICQMTVFWKREIMEEIGYFKEDEHLCMDYEYWLRIGKKYNPVYIDQNIANFRFYHTSKSGSKFKEQFLHELQLAKEYSEGKYPFALFVHQINYYKILFVYHILSFLKK